MDPLVGLLLQFLRSFFLPFSGGSADSLPTQEASCEENDILDDKENMV